jgi:hypothetical protein
MAACWRQTRTPSNAPNPAASWDTPPVGPESSEAQAQEPIGPGVRFTMSASESES